MIFRSKTGLCCIALLFSAPYACSDDSAATGGATTSGPGGAEVSGGGPSGGTGGGGASSGGGGQGGCADGFAANQNGTCTDINECTSGAATCDPDATCANTPGSYTCSCNAGFTGDGNTCAMACALPGGACSTDLSNIGPGDFQIQFALTTTATVQTAITSQRSLCEATDFEDWWQIRMLADGRLSVETSDQANRYDELSSTGSVNDGLQHNVVVARVNGSLTITIDCVLDATGDSLAEFGALPPLQNGTDVCVGIDGTDPLGGLDSLATQCMSHGMVVCDLPGGVCSTDLSNIGAGDFQIQFALTTTATVQTAITSQRSLCEATDFEDWWQIRMLPDGRLSVETSDQANRYDQLSSTGSVNDGLQHNVVVARVNGSLTITIDCVLDATGDSLAEFVALPPLQNGTDACVGVDGTDPLGGLDLLANQCMTHGL